ncbi:putative ribonuclease H protein [Sesamum angolense]|uniref:Ribonuclease H protein n=1 Tax=Sesamum angolense TaxID=2727404 RepID=A0AAE1T5W5_9LAMI|nr:putative ribonuclease H protein [Sesamum angolense]
MLNSVSFSALPIEEDVSEHPWSFASVSFFWADNKWDYLKFSQALPLNLVQQISNIPFDPTCADSIHSKLSTNGTFSTKSIWGQIRQTKSSQHLLREIWCPYIPPTMSVFLWRLINNNIPVDTRLQAKGIIKVWNHYAQVFNIRPPETGSITLFLSFWRFNAPVNQHIRMLVPLLILWFGWLERNDVKHRNANYNSDRIIWKVRQHIETIGRSNLAHLISWKGDKYLASSMGFSVKIQHKIKVLKVNWDKPERGWVKINTDGASKGNPGISGAGGIVRNEEGVAILAFYEFIGQATNMFSEVFGLYKALQLCNSRGINKIWIEVDAKNLIRLINCPSIAHWSLQNMLKEIRITLKSMEYRISHIYREGNKAADYLANLACSTQSSRVFRGDELEGQISGIIWCDRSSIPYIRSK